MTQLISIFLTAGLSILGGVTVFVIGQFVNEIIIEPYMRYRKLVRKIDKALIFFSDVYANPGLPQKYPKMKKLYETARKTLRDLSCEFSATYGSIQWKNFFVKIKWIVTLEEKDIVKKGLISLANLLWHSNDQLNVAERNLKTSEKIRKILKI